jgi:hypothetical protein
MRSGTTIMCEGVYRLGTSCLLHPMEVNPPVQIPVSNISRSTCLLLLPPHQLRVEARRPRLRPRTKAKAICRLIPVMRTRVVSLVQDRGIRQGLARHTRQPLQVSFSCYASSSMLVANIILSDDGFTLTSSKGPCTVLADESFSCAAGNTAGTVFTVRSSHMPSTFS